MSGWHVDSLSFCVLVKQCVGMYACDYLFIIRWKQLCVEWRIDTRFKSHFKSPRPLTHQEHLVRLLEVVPGSFGPFPLPSSGPALDTAGKCKSMMPYNTLKGFWNTLVRSKACWERPHLAPWLRQQISFHLLSWEKSERGHQTRTRYNCSACNWVWLHFGSSSSFRNRWGMQDVVSQLRVDCFQNLWCDGCTFSQLIFSREAVCAASTFSRFKFFVLVFAERYDAPHAVYIS